MPDPKIKKLEGLMSLLNDGVSKADLDTFAETIIQLVSKMHERNTSAKDEVEKTYQAIIKQFGPEGLETLRTAISTLQTKLREIDQKLGSVRDGRDGIDGISPNPDDIISEVMRRLPKAKNGRDGKDADIEAIVSEVLKRLPQQPQSTGGLRAVGFRGVQLYVDGLKKGIVQVVNFIAGAGVTLTHTTAQGRNDIIFSAASSSFSVLTATGTKNDSNLDFVFASQPTALVINGAWYIQTGGAITWTWNSGTSTATLSVPVGTGGSIYGVA
ncbi:hypothetical protein [Dongia sp.]|uniref:hypothetical protein n=1 Tax=Dongia sp. TaxID=1977262 RepID=UPI0037504D8C